MIKYLKTPIFKGLLFVGIIYLYYCFDMLNYLQARRIGLISFLIITTILYWKLILRRNKYLTFLILFIVFFLLLFVSFQATLQDIYSYEVDSAIVMGAIFNTDTVESKEFFLQYSGDIYKNIFLFVFLYLIYILIIFRYSTSNKTNNKQIFICVFFTLLTFLIHFNDRVFRSNPFLYYPLYYQQLSNEIEEIEKLAEQKKNISLSSTLTTFDVNTLVFVIGESDTRNNWELYGYQRNTNPRLKKEENIILFDHITSAGPSTVLSVTKMLTNATLMNPNLWKKTPSIISLAKYVGYKVFWISNQNTDKHGTLALFAYEADRTVFTNNGTSSGKGSFDESVLAPYQDALNDESRKKLIILHLMGAHPVYRLRYPDRFKKYNRLTKDSIVTKLRTQGRKDYAISSRNEYDNAIVYEDYILSSLLSNLKKAFINKAHENFSFLYIADHGQDVAHNSNFSGHNARAKQQWEIPMLLWRKDRFPNTVKYNKHINFQADNINHTILGLLGIQGKWYNPYQDILRQP